MLIRPHSSIPHKIIERRGCSNSRQRTSWFQRDGKRPKGVRKDEERTEMRTPTVQLKYIEVLRERRGRKRRRDAETVTAMRNPSQAKTVKV